MNEYKEVLNYHPPSLRPEQYPHIPVRMCNPDGWSSLITAYRVSLCMNAIGKFISRGIKGITSVARSNDRVIDTSTIPLICAYVNTTANMNDVARKDCQSIDDRVIEIDKMHSALQTKSKETLSSMNVSSILLLIITSLSDELSMIDMNLSNQFEKEFRYQQKDIRFCISCL